MVKTMSMSIISDSGSLYANNFTTVPTNRQWFSYSKNVAYMYMDKKITARRMAGLKGLPFNCTFQYRSVRFSVVSHASGPKMKLNYSLELIMGLKSSICLLP